MAVTVPIADQLVLPEPLEHQRPVYDSDVRFKVIRAGRRWGKTRIAFIASLAGHGPGALDGDPLHPGVLQGWDVVWIGKDYPQARQIWSEGVEPRLRHLGEDVVSLNITDKVASFVQGGTLHIRSAEQKALQGVRGIGARVKGVIIDEAAWLRFDYAWKSVLRPILVDNKGWAIIMSTTNAGLDGETDPETGNPISPSGFNRLCEAIQMGAVGRRREDGWAEWYGIGSDNPKIDAAEWRSFLTEYTPGSLALEQEVYAKLVASGAGLAFPEWRDDLHKQRIEAPAEAIWFGGLDWGYSAPAAFYAMAGWGDKRVLVRWEYYGTKRTPYDVGYAIGQGLKRFPKLLWVACDPSTEAVTDGSATILERVQAGLVAAMGADHAPGLFGAPAGPGSRVARKNLLHEMLRYEEATDADGGIFVPEWSRPRLAVHPECVHLLRTLPKLPRNPKKIEDVDTTAEDHAYDGMTYPLIARAPEVEREVEDLPHVNRDQHPGYEVKNGVPVERDPWKPLDERRDGQPYRTGVRWRFNRDHPQEE